MLWARSDVIGCPQVASAFEGRCYPCVVIPPAYSPSRFFEGRQPVNLLLWGRCDRSIHPFTSEGFWGEDDLDPRGLICLDGVQFGLLRCWFDIVLHRSTS